MYVLAYRGTDPFILLQIQVASYELVKNVNRDIKNFVEQLLSLAVSNNNSTALTNLRYPNSLPVVDSYADMGSLSSAYTAATGTISLEFLIKSSRTWTFAEPLVWEVWTLKVNCLKGIHPGTCLCQLSSHSCRRRQ